MCANYIYMYICTYVCLCCYINAWWAVGFYRFSEFHITFATYFHISKYKCMYMCMQEDSCMSMYVPTQSKIFHKFVYYFCFANNVFSKRAASKKITGRKLSAISRRWSEYCHYNMACTHTHICTFIGICIYLHMAEPKPQTCHIRDMCVSVWNCCPWQYNPTNATNHFHLSINAYKPR